MPIAQAVCCLQQIVVNLVVARFDVDRDDLSNVFACFDLIADALLVQSLPATGNLFIAEAWMRHGMSPPLAGNATAIVSAGGLSRYLCSGSSVSRRRSAIAYSVLRPLHSGIRTTKY